MTDPNFDQDYKDPAAPTGGLTREMKMLIGALMILLMVGALLYYFRNLNAGNEVDTVTASATTTSTATVTTNSDGSTTVSSVTTTSTEIPPLVPTASGTAVSGTATRELGGINPDEPLATVPARNPFRPLSVQKDGAATTAPAVNSTSPGNGGGSPSFPEPSVGITPPGDFTPSVSGSTPSANTTASTSFPDTSSDFSGSTSSTTDSSVSTTTWTLGPDDTPVAITGGSSSSSSSGSGDSGVSSTTWTLGPDDTPVAITGGSSVGSSTTASAGSASTGSRGTASSTGSGSSVTSNRPASPTASRGNGTSANTTGGAMESWDFGTPDSPASAASTTPGTGSTGTGNADTGSTTTASATPKAPVAGVSTPSLGTIANRPAPTSASSAAGSAVTGTAGNPGTGTTAGSAPSLSVPLPSPGQPELITQYGNNQGIGAPDDGTLLSRTLNRQNLRFTGAVLGPNNTAIFKSNDGFMVLEQGDLLPDTNIRVTGINTNSVTLTLGGEKLTLELEPLQQTQTAVN